MAAPRPLIDRLRTIPAPAAIILIAGTSFVVVPLVAGFFGAGASPAEAKPSNGAAHARTGMGGLPASMPTYMPNLTGSASPTTYAAPAAVASTGAAPGGGDAGGGVGSSNGRQRQPKATDPALTPPAGWPHPHPGSHGSYNPYGDRRVASATGSIYRHYLPAAGRPMMMAPPRIAPAAPVAPAQPRFVFSRPAAPFPAFGGGMGGGGFRFGGGGRHR